MRVYKLFRPDMTTHGGYQWAEGRRDVITAPGTELCTPQVFHAYRSDLLASLLNPIHANYSPAILWACETDAVVADDGLKIGTKDLRPVAPLDLPNPSAEQRVRFALLCALAVYKDPAFERWAGAWLSGADRSEASARAAARAAEAARAARAATAARAAWAAAEAAEVAAAAAAEAAAAANAATGTASTVGTAPLNFGKLAEQAFDVAAV